MNYALHYDRLIERARHRTLEGYRERHHIIPKCMGGGNEPANLVDLTPEEHYVAHQLLVKIHPEHAGLAVAAIRMARKCAGRKAYGWLRRRRSECLRGVKLPPTTVAKVAAWHRGKKRSPETRARISAARSGKKFGPHTAERKAKISNARTGCRHSHETKQMLSDMRRGKTASSEARAKMTASHLKRWRLLREQGEAHSIHSTNR